MRIQSVILDTNILLKDYKLSGYELRKLIKTKELYSIELCIPEIVKDECIGNFIADYKTRIHNLDKSINEINELADSNSCIAKTNINKKTNSFVNKYKARLNKFIKDNNIQIIKYPQVTHKTVVGKMYEKKPPFNNGNNKCSEKGYKDFLIIESIRNYTINRKCNERVILVTQNMNDFIDKNNSQSGDLNVIPFSKELNIKSTYIARSLANLFEELKSNLAFEKIDAGEIPTSVLEEMFSGALRDSFWLYETDIIGIITFEITPSDISCKISDYTVEFTEEANIINISGIMEVSMKCSFEIDNYDAYLLDDTFLFRELVNRRINEKKLSLKQNWTESFTDVESKFECIFNYLDLTYFADQPLEPMDPIFLSISKI